MTNQRGVALGLYGTGDVERLHVCFSEELATHGAKIDGYFHHPHDKNTCACRKPDTGLFEQACAFRPEIEWSTSVMTGDSLSDIEASARIGMQTIFIDGDSATKKADPEKARTLAGAMCESLLEAAKKYPAQLRARAVQGIAQVAVGTGGNIVGGALDATGLGAVAGVSINVVSTAVTVEGMGAVTMGSVNLFKAGENFSSGTKQDVKAAVGGKCQSCGVKTTPGQQSQKGATPPGTEGQTNHIQPKSKGGTNDPFNAQHLCRDCNIKKSNKMPNQQAVSTRKVDEDGR